MSSSLKEIPQKKPSSGRGHGGSMSAQQLRQRRARILKDRAMEAQDEKQWLEISEQGKDRRNYYMIKLYLVVFTAAVVTVLAILNHTRPSFLFRRRKAPPPIHISTRYPPNVIVERDLPRFFRTYSIATPKNKHAREAAIQVANSRNALKHGTGNQRVILKAWDSSNVDLLLERNVCGRRFELVYQVSSQERQDDLLMWCLLTTRIVEGFFLGSVQMIGNAFILAKKRGMIVQKTSSVLSSGEETASNRNSRISNAYYLHPTHPEEDSPTAPLPAMVLEWLLDHPEDSLENPSASLQETIYTLITSEKLQDRYMILDEVCQKIQPERAIGKQCTTRLEEDDCCYFVVPRSEGGRPGTRDDDDIAAHRRGLGEAGMTD